MVLTVEGLLFVLILARMGRRSWADDGGGVNGSDS